ncbi:MAG: hypothetical protein V3S37_02775 [Dehalococcoidia bacterium]
MAFADAGVADVTITNVPNYRIKVTISDTVHRGDPIGQDTSGAWKRALSTVGSVVQARLIALQGGDSGEVIEAVRSCRLSGGRVTGATATNSIYVAEGATAGLFTETKPTTSGDADTAIGAAVDATTLDIACQSNPDSLVA